MATYKIKKQPKPEVSKEPDEFVTLMDKITRYATQNRAMIIGIVVILFIGMGVYFGLIYIQENKTAEFNQKLFQLDPDSDNYIEELKALIEENPNLEIAQLSRTQLIEYHVQKNELEEAITVIDQILKDKPQQLEATLIFSKANLQWQLDKPDQAIETLDKLVNNDENELSANAKFLKSMILESKGEVTQAKEIYQAILNDPESPQDLKNSIITRLIQLN